LRGDAAVVFELGGVRQRPRRTDEALCAEAGGAGKGVGVVGRLIRAAANCGLGTGDSVGCGVGHRGECGLYVLRGLKVYAAELWR
jgi:hypothetical protein